MRRGRGGSVRGALALAGFFFGWGGIGLGMEDGGDATASGDRIRLPPRPDADAGDAGGGPGYWTAYYDFYLHSNTQASCQISYPDGVIERFRAPVVASRRHR